jgi:hypothetical protein
VASVCTAKFNGKEQKAFEWFCSLLFSKEHNQPIGPLRYFNRAGIDEDPIVVGEEVIGWQVTLAWTGARTTNSNVHAEEEQELFKDYIPLEPRLALAGIERVPARRRCDAPFSMLQGLQETPFVFWGASGVRPLRSGHPVESRVRSAVRLLGGGDARPKSRPDHSRASASSALERL